jgi:fructose-specific phosphotransferase system IIB component
MNIVAVTACPTGIAHTYMAAEQLEKAGKKLGHKIKVETQGAMGIEDELSAKDIAEADYVLLACDIATQKRDRFEGKRIVEVKIQDAIKRPEDILNGLLG